MSKQSQREFSFSWHNLNRRSQEWANKKYVAEQEKKAADLAAEKAAKYEEEWGTEEIEDPNPNTVADNELWSVIGCILIGFGIGPLIVMVLSVTKMPKIDYIMVAAFTFICLGLATAFMYDEKASRL